MESTIKLKIIDDNNVQRLKRWRVNENNTTLKELVEFGRQHLKFPINKKFNFFEIQQGGERLKMDGEDDLIELGNDYEIVEESVNSKKFA